MEKERKELEEWNKSKRLEKIQKLKEKWRKNKDGGEYETILLQRMMKSQKQR